MNPIIFKIEASIRYDEICDQWEARTVFTEYTNGRQYGGSVVDALISKAGGDREAFLKTVRRRVNQKINTIWT